MLLSNKANFLFIFHLYQQAESRVILRLNEIKVKHWVFWHLQELQAQAAMRDVL